MNSTETASLSILDAAFLQIESARRPSHAAVLEIFRIPDGAPDTFVRDVVAAFRDTPPAKPFNMKVGGGPRAAVAPKLVAVDEIDIQYHVRHVALPAPGGELELGELVSQLHSVSLDRDRPLWTCHVIEGLEDNRFAVYTKIHHSMTDGVNGMRLIMSSLSTDPDGPSCGMWQVPPVDDDEGGGFSWPSPTEVIKTGTSLVKGYAGLINRGDDAVRLPYEAPPSEFNKRVTNARRVATCQLEFARVRRVAKATESSVNDVFMAMCSGALREYLDEQDALPDRSLLAAVMVSLREPGEEGGNSIGILWSRLGTELADARDRLEVIQDSMRASKDHLRAMSPSARRIYTTSTLVPIVATTRLGVANLAPAPMNVLLSNVPGPRQTLYLRGARMEALYPVSLPLPKLPVNITCISYADTLNITVTGARDAVPHLQRIAVYLENALLELEKTVDG